MEPALSYYRQHIAWRYKAFREVKEGLEGIVALEEEKRKEEKAKSEAEAEAAEEAHLYYSPECRRRTWIIGIAAGLLMCVGIFFTLAVIAIRIINYFNGSEQDARDEYIAIVCASVASFFGLIVAVCIFICQRQN